MLHSWLGRFVIIRICCVIWSRTYRSLIYSIFQQPCRKIHPHLSLCNYNLYFIITMYSKRKCFQKQNSLQIPSPLQTYTQYFCVMIKNNLLRRFVELFFAKSKSTSLHIKEQKYFFLFLLLPVCSSSLVCQVCVCLLQQPIVCGFACV